MNIDRNRRFVYPLFILQVMLFSCSVSEKKQEIHKPNIILILADNIGFETLGCYGMYKQHG
jgi:arylsulfatase